MIILGVPALILLLGALWVMAGAIALR